MKNIIKNFNTSEANILKVVSKFLDQALQIEVKANLTLTLEEIKSFQVKIKKLQYLEQFTSPLMKLLCGKKENINKLLESTKTAIREKTLKKCKKVQEYLAQNTKQAKKLTSEIAKIKLPEDEKSYQRLVEIEKELVSYEGAVQLVLDKESELQKAYVQAKVQIEILKIKWEIYNFNNSDLNKYQRNIEDEINSLKKKNLSDVQISEINTIAQNLASISKFLGKGSKFYSLISVENKMALNQLYARGALSNKNIESKGLLNRVGDIFSVMGKSKNIREVEAGINKLIAGMTKGDYKIIFGEIVSFEFDANVKVKSEPTYLHAIFRQLLDLAEDKKQREINQIRWSLAVAKMMFRRHWNVKVGSMQDWRFDRNTIQIIMEHKKSQGKSTTWDLLLAHAVILQKHLDEIIPPKTKGKELSLEELLKLCKLEKAPEIIIKRVTQKYAGTKDYKKSIDYIIKSSKTLSKEVRLLKKFTDGLDKSPISLAKEFQEKVLLKAGINIKDYELEELSDIPIKYLWSCDVLQKIDGKDEKKVKKRQEHIDSFNRINKHSKIHQRELEVLEKLQEESKNIDKEIKKIEHRQIKIKQDIKREFKTGSKGQSSNQVLTKVYDQVYLSRDGVQSSEANLKSDQKVVSLKDNLVNIKSKNAFYELLNSQIELAKEGFSGHPKTGLRLMAVDKDGNELVRKKDGNYYKGDEKIPNKKIYIGLVEVEPVKYIGKKGKFIGFVDKSDPLLKSYWMFLDHMLGTFSISTIPDLDEKSADEINKILVKEKVISKEGEVLKKLSKSIKLPCPAIARAFISDMLEGGLNGTFPAPLLISEGLIDPKEAISIYKVLKKAKVIQNGKVRDWVLKEDFNLDKVLEFKAFSQDKKAHIIQILKLSRLGNAQVWKKKTKGYSHKKHQTIPLSRKKTGIIDLRKSQETELSRKIGSLKDLDEWKKALKKEQSTTLKKKINKKKAQVSANNTVMKNSYLHLKKNIRGLTLSVRLAIIRSYQKSGLSEQEFTKALKAGDKLDEINEHLNQLGVNRDSFVKLGIKGKDPIVGIIYAQIAVFNGSKTLSEWITSIKLDKKDEKIRQRRIKERRKWDMKHGLTSESEIVERLSNNLNKMKTGASFDIKVEHIISGKIPKWVNIVKDSVGRPEVDVNVRVEGRKESVFKVQMEKDGKVGLYITNALAAKFGLLTRFFKCFHLYGDIGGKKAWGYKLGFSSIEEASAWIAGFMKGKTGLTPLIDKFDTIYRFGKKEINLTGEAKLYVEFPFDDFIPKFGQDAEPSIGLGLRGKFMATFFKENENNVWESMYKRGANFDAELGIQINIINALLVTAFEYIADSGIIKGFAFYDIIKQVLNIDLNTFIDNFELYAIDDLIGGKFAFKVNGFTDKSFSTEGQFFSEVISNSGIKLDFGLLGNWVINRIGELAGKTSKDHKFGVPHINFALTMKNAGIKLADIQKADPKTYDKIKKMLNESKVDDVFSINKSLPPETIFEIAQYMDKSSSKYNPKKAKKMLSNSKLYTKLMIERKRRVLSSPNLKEKMASWLNDKTENYFAEDVTIFLLGTLGRGVLGTGYEKTRNIGKDQVEQILLPNLKVSTS
ncbi:hypothetical protein ACFLZV_03320 [Candidatus Margulisiibacteriota bacterium]